MSAPQPDRVMLRAVAEVMIEEEKARSAADAMIAADLARIRERLDDYGNVIETRFLGLTHQLRDQVEAEVAKAAIAEREAVIAEATVRAEADRELGADLARMRERLDEYGNVIDTRFLTLEHRMRDQVASYVASLELKDGAPGERGEAGERGEVGDRGERGDPGERGEPGPAGYVGRACGRFDPTAAYRAMDVVAFNGSEWRATKDDPGPLPGDGWMLGAKGQKGDKGAPGERGDRGERGPPGPPGIGISDISIDNGVLVIMLSNGKACEFMLEAAA